MIRYCSESNYRIQNVSFKAVGNNDVNQKTSMVAYHNFPIPKINLILFSATYKVKCRMISNWFVGYKNGLKY